MDRLSERFMELASDRIKELPRVEGRTVVSLRTLRNKRVEYTFHIKGDDGGYYYLGRLPHFKDAEDDKSLARVRKSALSWIKKNKPPVKMSNKEKEEALCPFIDAETKKNKKLVKFLHALPDKKVREILALEADERAEVLCEPEFILNKLAEFSESRPYYEKLWQMMD